MDGHQPDGVHMESACRDLTKIALLGEQNELAHAVEDTLDRRAGAERSAVADEIQKLPDGNRLHPLTHTISSRVLGEQIGPIEQISGEPTPGRRAGYSLNIGRE